MALFDIGADAGQPAGPDYGEPYSVVQPKRIGKFGVGVPPAAGPVGGPAAVTPAGSAPAPSGAPMPQASGPAMIRAAMPPAAPQMDTAELQRRQAAIDKYSQPIDKSDPKYKMSIGQRLLGAVADFAAGMGGRQAPVYIGPGATNAQYARDESTRESNLGAAQTQMKNFDTGYDEQLKGYKEQLGAYDKGQLAQEREERAQKYVNAIDPNSITQDDSGKWYGTTYGGQKQETSPPKWYQTQQNKAQQRSDYFDQNTQEADRLGLKGKERTYFIANGKLREPNPGAEATTAAAKQRHSDAEADRQQRQDDLNFNRYQARLAQWNKDKEQITKDQSAQYAKAEDQWRKDHATNGKLSSEPLNSPAAQADLQRRKDQIESGIQARFQELGPAPQETARTREVVQTPAAPDKNTKPQEKMIQVQIPGQPPGQIPASKRGAFLKRYPKAKVIG